MSAPRPAPRLALAPPTAVDADAFVAAVRASRRLHGRWVAPPSTADAYAAWLARSTTADTRTFVVRRCDAGRATHGALPLAGVVALSGIAGGNFRSAYLGWYAFAPHDGQGVMRAAVETLLRRQAFGALKMNRVEANIQPGNVASLALARACGFTREGFSPRYLKIRGRWCDHERWARLAPR